MNFHFFSLVGPKGSNNDAVLAPFEAGGAIWCAIADGVGSSENAGRAAQTSIQVVREISGSEDMATIFSMVQTQLKYMSKSQERSDLLRTTLTVVRIEQAFATIGHVGDTRVTHYREEKVMSRTQDQTELQRLIEEGIISKHQATRYPRRNVLTSVMAVDRPYNLAFSKFAIQKSDRILLTSDGFHGSILKRTIARISNEHPNFEDFWNEIEGLSSSINFDDDASCLAIQI